MTKNSCTSSKECAAAKSLASPAAEARRRRHLQRGEARAGLSRLSLRINDLGEVQQLLSLHEQQQQHVRHRQRQRRLPPAVAGDVQQRLAESGVVILPSLVDVKLCEAMAAEVHTRVMAAAIDTYDVKGHWLRKDLGPSLIGDGMYPTILGALSTLFADVLEGILGTDPELYEFSTMVSYPGAACQDPHSDVTSVDGTDQTLTSEEQASSKCRCVTGFLYLDTVDESTAPLQVWPGSHTIAGGHLDDAETLRTVNSTLVTVPAGSVALYNCRLLHRGTANTSPRARPTLYFSFVSRDGIRLVDDGPDPEVTLSIKDAYWKSGTRLSLHDLALGHAVLAAAVQNLEQSYASLVEQQIEANSNPAVKAEKTRTVKRTVKSPKDGKDNGDGDRTNNKSDKDADGADENQWSVHEEQSLQEKINEEADVSMCAELLPPVDHPSARASMIIEGNRIVQDCSKLQRRGRKLKVCTHTTSFECNDMVARGEYCYPHDHPDADGLVAKAWADCAL
eukprot:gene19807-4356_t